MALRLHELHPILAHFPLVLMPLSVASDVVGSVTDNPFMLGVGRVAMQAAVTSMALTAASGTIAQEGVKASREPGVAQDFLTTHRNMNIVVFGATAALTVMRTRQNRPNGLYFTLAAGAGLALAYTAYLGGEMVYKYGVGVEAARGVDYDRSPELKLRNTGVIARTKVGNLASGLARAARSLFFGPRFPALRNQQSRLEGGESSRYYYSEKVDEFGRREREHDAAHHRYSDDDYGGLHS